MMRRRSHVGPPLRERAAHQRWHRERHRHECDDRDEDERGRTSNDHNGTWMKKSRGDV